MYSIAAGYILLTCITVSFSIGWIPRRFPCTFWPCILQPMQPRSVYGTREDYKNSLQDIRYPSYWRCHHFSQSLRSSRLRYCKRHKEISPKCVVFCWFGKCVVVCSFALHMYNSPVVMIAKIIDLWDREVIVLWTQTFVFDLKLRSLSGVLRAVLSSTRRRRS